MDCKWDDEDAPPVVRNTSDKWADEDADDDVKDNWDDSDEEEKPVKVVEKPKKLSTKQRIAEKQAAKDADLQAKREEIRKLTQDKDKTPQQKREEKARLEKIQIDSDLEFAKDMMGLNDVKEEDSPPPTLGKTEEEEPSFKNLDLNKQENLVKFGSMFADKVKTTSGLQKTLFYATYLETFFKELTVDVGPDELKKVIAVLNSVQNEKVKAAKPAKNKKKNKGSLFVEKRERIVNEVDDRFIDDLDDFI